ncbi:CHAT domain-containing protein [Kibdelosporangium persicum]|uniref:CHAT domain-containing protein n=1 Tax=Kibdelosporangium persicum TaxID=2698649 RepID=A0ABX2FCP5_9PSEU|nr:CHAT domain-containing tetratricopeptide repeat protein [Kibdelosporangium persicum]NRN68656.1 CHAT domain-containing protein [Kibdelosporangium persicum]
MSHAEAIASVERGEFARALEQARQALDTAAAADVGQIWLTIAWIELERGNPRACARELRKARESGAPPARIRCLDGLRMCAIGAYEQAVTELSAAMRELGGDPKWLANALTGRGISRAYLFRLAAADRDFAAAASILTRLGEHERVAVCIHNRGFVALQAGDLPKALELFERASGGLRAGRAEALIDHASALLAAGMTRDASALLEQAEPLLAGRESRLAEAVLAAGYCALRAGDIDHAAGEAKRAQELFRAQRRPAWIAAADALALRTNLVDVSAAKRVADRCLRWGKRTEAAELLLDAAKVAPELLVRLRSERFAATARLRAIGWLAEARLATSSQARFAACQAGMRVVTEYAAAMGPGAGELAAELAGVAIAQTSRARTVFQWIERQRIIVLPQVDTADLVELRAAEAEGDVGRAARLEDRMRRHTRASYGTGHIDDLVEALGERMLVTFAVCQGSVVACTVVDGVVRVHHLGRPTVAAHLSTELDDQLLRPLRTGDRPLVIVPAAGMSEVVWAAMPSCAGRPVSLAPSTAAWLRATRATTGAGAVAVAGPGLNHAEREAGLLGHRVIESTVDSVLAVMDGADLVHVAAHGKFRRDAPMFSCLQLDDGPLYGYDLARLKRAPRILVLSACEVARADVFANVLLDRGGQAMIASILPVPDEAAVDLMADFHDRLRAGHAPAKALADAQVRHGHLGFSCWGSG